MKSKPQLLDSEPGRRSWTGPQAYIESLARKRTFRRSHGEPRRTQPESPRLLLSTLPFLALIALLGILAIAIFIAALPGNQPRAKQQQVAAKEKGVAERGWFQEAQKQFHN